MNDSSVKTQTELVRFHLLLGWGGMMFFLLLGVALEALHAFKVPLYLDANNEGRRLMWRLAHAHGALLSLLHMALSWTFSRLGRRSFPHPARLISRSFTASTLLLPGGFFAGGAFAISGDPSAWIALVPAGATLLAAAVGLCFFELLKTDNDE